MPNRLLSRLLKDKLHPRRSSTVDPTTLDPRVHPNSISPDPAKTPYSIVSAPSDDHLGADRCQENQFPARGLEDNQDHENEDGDEDENEVARRLADEPSPSSTLPSSPTLQRCPHAPAGHCTPPSSEANTSLLPTPLTDDLPSPLEIPQHSDETGLQSVHFHLRGLPAENQPTTTSDTVAGRPADHRRSSTSSFFPPSFPKRPSLAIRRQSLLPASHQHLISGLLERQSISSQSGQGAGRAPPAPAEMAHRRVWVKRPAGSATLVPCVEDAVVDELRDQVIMKYANSLGRSFDSPDIVIRITPREGSGRPGHPERLLSPEEMLSSVLDAYYPGGQTIEEALVIEAPTRRTPKLSPGRHSYYHHHHPEPGEHGDYFPLMPVNPNQPTPPPHSANSGAGANAPSISILATGVAPPLPSPGNRGTRHHRRPPLTRHTTNSPTLSGQATNVTGKLMSLSAGRMIEVDVGRLRHLPTCPTSSLAPCAYRADTTRTSVRITPN